MAAPQTRSTQQYKPYAKGSQTISCQMFVCGLFAFSCQGLPGCMNCKSLLGKRFPRRCLKETAVIWKVWFSPKSLRSWFGLSILRNNTLIHLHMIYKPICQPELWVRTDSSSHIDRDDLFLLCLSGEDGRLNRQLLRLLHRLLFLAADSYTFVWTLTVKRWAGPFTPTWDMCEGKVSIKTAEQQLLRIFLG